MTVIAVKIFPEIKETAAPAETVYYIDHPAPAFNFFADEEWDEEDVWSYEVRDEEEEWDVIEEN